MTPAELRSMHVANHKACLLASAMRDCRNCLFRDAAVQDVAQEVDITELINITDELTALEKVQKELTGEFHWLTPDTVSEPFVDDWSLPGYNYHGDLTHIGNIGATAFVVDNAAIREAARTNRANYITSLRRQGVNGNKLADGMEATNK